MRKMDNNIKSITDKKNMSSLELWGDRTYNKMLRTTNLEKVFNIIRKTYKIKNPKFTKKRKNLKHANLIPNT